MPTTLTHEHLSKRHQFNGIIALETGLHIGSGRGSNLTDALVTRTAKGEPYIPGSSFKGALRSAVERIAPNLSHLHPPVKTCQLIQNGEVECLTVTHGLRERLKKIQEDCETAQRTSQPVANILEDAQLGYLRDEDICSDTEMNTPGFERRLPYRFIEHKLCDTCKLFGSTWFAAKVRVGDLSVGGHWVDVTEIRDGVGIDRDTETASAKIKFDLEVVPAQTEFVFQLTAENLSVRDLGLLCIGIQEFRTGMVPIGGRSTRGLGGCQLFLSDVLSVDLGNVSELARYLASAKSADRMTRHDPDEFITTSIRAMIEEGGH